MLGEVADHGFRAVRVIPEKVLFRENVYPVCEQRAGVGVVTIRRIFEDGVGVVANHFESGLVLFLNRRIG